MTEKDQFVYFHPTRDTRKHIDTWMEARELDLHKCRCRIVKTQTTERVTGGYSQDVVGVHPELCADVGGLVPPLARLLVHHLRQHLHTGGGSGVIFPVPSAV